MSAILQHDHPHIGDLSPSNTWRAMLNDAGMWAAGNCGQLLHSLWGSRTTNSIGILTYHRIAPKTPGVPAPLHNVTPQRFCQQMSGLLSRGLTPWPLQQVLDYRRLNKKIPANVFVVTFDDGFESVYTHAWPIMKHFNIPATIFLNTAYLNQVEPFPFDEWGLKWENKVPAEFYRPLSVAQCHAMQDGMLIELGAHTHTHQDFRGRASDFRADMQTNIEQLHELFGIERPTFAFPFGSPNLKFAGGDLERAARQSGVTCALTTQSVLVNPLKDDPFRWGRMNVFAWDTASTLAAKIAGWYSWAPKLRQQLARTKQAGSWLWSMQALPVSTWIMDV
jgi:peptidoglycan/xylan/chitin deacetylase (PgdA/CDA1 family)